MYSVIDFFSQPKHMLWIIKRTVSKFLTHDIMDQLKLVVKLNGLVYQKFIKSTEWNLYRKALLHQTD